MKVAIVQDYLTQRGGAERVVLVMARAFPNAAIHTTLYNPDSTFPEFRDLDVRVTPLNRVGYLRRHHQMSLPLLPWALKKVDVGDADIVIASSSGWAHGVQAEVPVVVYCHNPPRWLHQKDHYVMGLGLPERLGLRALESRLRHWDAWAAGRASRYIVNSRPVRDRVLEAYGTGAEVLAPPVGLDPRGARTPIEGIEPGFLLTVGRLRGYKATKTIADAVSLMPEERLVVVGGTPDGLVDHPNVTVVENISDAQLRWLYANANMLVAMSYEDFGLTPPEANSFGVPSLVLRAGGYLDTTIDGVNGLFVDSPTVPAVVDGIRRMRGTRFESQVIRRHAAQFDELSFGARLESILHEVLDDVPQTIRLDERVPQLTPSALAMSVEV